MTRIGIVGIGFMGRIHFLASQSLKDAKVTAVCSRDAAKLAGDWTNTRGNFGPPPGRVDLSGVKTFADYTAMLADPDIDLIDICTVTDQHATLAIQALQAGKHVLVEKAIALTTADADAMLAAAKAAKKLLMVAHVLPFFPEFAYAAKVIREGTFGKVTAAHFTRVIARPDWSAAIGDAAKTGGPAVDLHIHDTHFIGLVCGVPQAVFSSGVVQGDAVNYVSTQYLYGPGGPSVTCSSGAVAMGGRPFVHGFEIFLEHATLSYSSSGVALTLFKKDGTTEVVTLEGGGDPLAAFIAELQTAADAVKSGVEPALLSGQLARDALVLCHRECESVRTGKVVVI
ncbi:Gfo/Idh/MocA family oxidoreductase [soil metagenome]